MSSRSTASPVTRIPAATSASRSDSTKWRVGFTTATCRARPACDAAAAFTGRGTVPVTSRRGRSRCRWKSSVGGMPGALVRVRFHTCKPQWSPMRITAGSPTAGPGMTDISTTLSLSCSAPIGAEYQYCKSSQAHPIPSGTSSNALSSPTMRPRISVMPCSRRARTHSAKTAFARPSRELMVGSPPPVTMRSPSSVPAWIVPADSSVVGKRASHPRV